MTRTEPSRPDHDVLGLEVAVDEPGGVRGREARAPRRRRPRGSARQVRGAAPRARRPSVSPSTNSIARNDPVADRSPASWTTTTFGCDRRAIALRLAQEALARALAPLAVRRDLVQELERDLAIELRIVGRVDLAHAAAADEAQDDVAADTVAPGARRISPAAV